MQNHASKSSVGSPKAFSKSSRSSFHYSIIILTVFMWSKQEWLLLKPALSTLDVILRLCSIRWYIIVAKILLKMDSTVIPRKLLHSDQSPFFRILMIVPNFHLSGIDSVSHISVTNGWIDFLVVLYNYVAVSSKIFFKIYCSL